MSQFSCRMNPNHLRQNFSQPQYFAGQHTQNEMAPVSNTSGQRQMFPVGHMQFVSQNMQGFPVNSGFQPPMGAPVMMNQQYFQQQVRVTMFSFKP